LRYDVDAGWSSLVARWAHNPKVAGSNPAPATIGLIPPTRNGPVLFQALILVQFLRGRSGGIRTEENTQPKSQLEAFQELAAQAPQNVMVRYSLGLEYVKAKRNTEAEGEFREVLHLKPDYSAAYRELGKVLTALERFAEAKTIYEKGLDVACQKGDLQTKKEIEVFLNRITKGSD
jgi:tetratricopeptide (TPR) repeat protein